MKAIEKRRAAAGQSGFTLIELLVVIAILGILAAVVVFAVGNTTDNAKVKACKLEKRELKTGIEAWKGNGGSSTAAENDATSGYPATLQLLATTTDSSVKFLQDAPAAADFSYDSATGAIAATAGGKWSAQNATDCNA